MIREFVTIANKIGFAPEATGIFRKKYRWKFVYSYRSRLSYDTLYIRPDCAWEFYTRNPSSGDNPHGPVSTSERPSIYFIDEVYPAVRATLTKWAAEHL